MADFINFEVSVEDQVQEEEEEEEEEIEVSNSDLDSLSSFIDNEETEDDVNFYRNFDNVESDIEETLKNEYDKSLEEIDDFDKISNLCESSEDEAEIDEFENAAEKVKCFGETLMPKTKPEEETEHNNFIKVILYAIRFDKQNKTDISDKNEFKKVIDENLIDQLDKEKYEFILDLQKFNNDCYEINYVLSKYNHFLRVFELKNKFRHLTMKEPKNKTLLDKFLAVLLRNIMVFRPYQLHFLEEKEKNLNRLILFTSQQKIQKFVYSVIIQKHIQIFITKKI